MIPATFDYTSPRTLDEAVGLLAGRADARVIAGGQSLIPAMTVGRLAPALLVDVRAIDDLRGIATADAGGLRIGAATTLDELATSADVRTRAGALADAAAAAGDPQVRNRGTLGGALAEGHPAGDLIAAAIALAATITLVGPDGSRSVPADAFVSGPFATTAGADEILTSLAVPAPAAGSGSAYLKQPHPGSGYALCGAAASVTLRDHEVTAVHLALTGATDHPAVIDVPMADGAGRSPESAARAAGAAIDAAGLTFVSDLAASAEYRAQLARVLAGRVVNAAAQRAREA